MPNRVKTYTVFEGTNREFTGNKNDIIKHFHIGKNTLYHRMNDLNLTLEEAIDYKTYKEYIVFKDTDREFKGNLSDISRRFNISLQCLSDRINRLNLSLEEAIDYKGYNVKTIFKGTNREFIGNLSQIYEHFNINEKTLKKYIKDNNGDKNNVHDIEIAIDSILKNRYRSNFNPEHTVFKNTDREFKGNLTQISKHFNIKYGTLMHRMNKLNLSLEQAIDYDNNKINEIYTVFEEKDKEFKGNLNQIAKHFNVDYNYLFSKIRRNKSKISIENAIDYYISIIDNKNIYTVFKDTNKEFTGNLYSISKHFSISYNALNNRINKTNLTVEKAIEQIKNYNRNRNFKIYTVFIGTDMEFKGNLNSISKHFHIDRCKLSNRMKNLNITIEEAILLTSYQVKQNNLTYKSQNGTMRELCQKFDKNFIEVYNKVKSNHTFEWAMDSTDKPYEE